jgi:hypothetical protein
MAGRRLASNITDAQLQELHAMLDELQASQVHGELNNCFTLNIAFHDRMIELAGNATMPGLYRQVVNRMHLLRRRGFSIAGSSQASHTKHRLILEALASRDPKAVALAMRQHVQAGFQRAIAAHSAEDPFVGLRHNSRLNCRRRQRRRLPAVGTFDVIVASRTRNAALIQGRSRSLEPRPWLLHGRRQPVTDVSEVSLWRHCGRIN